MQSNNTFAALDDSDSENEAIKSTPKRETTKKSNPTVADPSKLERRNNDRNERQRHQRPPVRDGKRTHDRRSGTGRGKEIKKGGGGARNWGSDKNEARKLEGAIEEDQVENLVTEKVAEDAEAGKEKTAEAAEETKEGEKKSEEKEKEVVVEEVEEVTYSYDEYMATKTIPDAEAFKPVEEKKFENAFAGVSVKAKVEEGTFMGGGTEKTLKKKKEKKQKEVLTPGFRSDAAQRSSRGDGERRDNNRDRGGNRDRDSNRDRDGNRDRRGGKGGRGRGEGRGGRERAGAARGGGARQSAQLDVADVNSFPSLG